MQRPACGDSSLWWFGRKRKRDRDSRKRTQFWLFIFRNIRTHTFIWVIFLRACHSYCQPMMSCLSWIILTTAWAILTVSLFCSPLFSFILWQKTMSMHKKGSQSVTFFDSIHSRSAKHVQLYKFISIPAAVQLIRSTADKRHGYGETSKSNPRFTGKRTVLNLSGP